MSYVDNEANQNFERAQAETIMHTPTPVSNNYHTKITTYTIFSKEEGIMIRLVPAQDSHFALIIRYIAKIIPTL